MTPRWPQDDPSWSQHGPIVALKAPQTKQSDTSYAFQIEFGCKVIRGIASQDSKMAGPCADCERLISFHWEAMGLLRWTPCPQCRGDAPDDDDDECEGSASNAADSGEEQSAPESRCHEVSVAADSAAASPSQSRCLGVSVAADSAAASATSAASQPQPSQPQPPQAKRQRAGSHHGPKGDDSPAASAAALAAASATSAGSATASATSATSAAASAATSAASQLVQPQQRADSDLRPQGDDSQQPEYWEDLQILDDETLYAMLE